VNQSYAKSSANIDLVRSIFARWERWDFSSVAWAHPEIEYVFVDGPHPGTRTGLTGMANANRDFLSAWEDWRIAADDYHELDDERVLVFTRMGGRGKSSGMELGNIRHETANLFHLRSGKVTRLVIYWDQSRARAAFAIAPTADSSDA